MLKGGRQDPAQNAPILQGESQAERAIRPLIDDPHLSFGPPSQIDGGQGDPRHRIGLPAKRHQARQPTAPSRFANLLPHPYEGPKEAAVPVDDLQRQNPFSKEGLLPIQIRKNGGAETDALSDPGLDVGPLLRSENPGNGVEAPRTALSRCAVHGIGDADLTNEPEGGLVPVAVNLLPAFFAEADPFRPMLPDDAACVQDLIIGRRARPVDVSGHALHSCRLLDSLHAQATAHP